MKLTSTKAAVYLRQSLDRDQTQLAVTRQREDCLKLCEQRGWQPVEYVDNSISATTGKTRPAYQQLLADIRDGTITAVAVWDLDRLHRQPRELEDFIDLADRHRVQLATVTGECDLSTDNGRLYARIKGAVGKSETERKSARQKRAAKQLADMGKPKWRRAFGYLPYTGDARDDDGQREPDPRTAPLVRDAYAALLAGASLNEMATLFNAAGAHGLTGRPWTAGTVSLFLRSPRNAGYRTYTDDRGETTINRGTWTPLIDFDTWDAARAVLSNEQRLPGPKSVRQHALTGMMMCGKCNDGVSYLSGNRSAQNALCYVCKRCRGVSVRGEQVSPLLYDLVAGRLARPDAKDLLRKEHHDAAEAKTLRAQAQVLLARLDEIADERADGLLTGTQAQRATERITAKLAAIEGRQQDQQRLRVFDGLPLATPEVGDAIRALSPARFRAVLGLLCTVTILPCGKGGHRIDPETGRKIIDHDRVRVGWR